MSNINRLVQEALILRKNPLYNQEDLEEHHAIAAVIYDKDNRVLMLEHVKYNFWTIPVGKVLKNQALYDALKEEVFEECNVKILKAKEITSKDFDYLRKEIPVKVHSHLFEVEKWTGDVKNKEPQKHSDMKFMTIDEIKKLKDVSDMTKLFLLSVGQ